MKTKEQYVVDVISYAYNDLTVDAAILAKDCIPQLREVDERVIVHLMFCHSKYFPSNCTTAQALVTHFSEKLKNNSLTISAYWILFYLKQNDKRNRFVFDKIGLRKPSNLTLEKIYSYDCRTHFERIKSKAMSLISSDYERFNAIAFFVDKLITRIEK